MSNTSPLELYKEIAKEFKVTKEMELHPRQKIAFFAEQANQIRMVINRLLGDLAKARTNLDSVSDGVAKGAYQGEVNKYEGELRQMVGNLEFFMQMEKELTEENPNVEVSNSDVPESD